MESNKLYIFLLLLTTINLISSQEDVIFSKESGFYNSEFLLTLSTSSESFQIFYTEDGTDPTNSITSKEYTEPIKIIDRSQENNYYSNYEENLDSPLSISIYYKYKKPPFLIEKAMVIRAVSKNGDNYGKVLSKTYFITDQELLKFRKYTVVSLVTNPDNLFDPEKGIYVLGNIYMDWKKTTDFDPESEDYIDVQGNCYMRGSEWEREASLSIFENGKMTIDQDVGIRLKGYSSRDSPQKSFHVFARKKYGKKKIKSSTLFPNNKDIYGNPITEYDSISLRAITNEERARDFFINRIIYKRNLASTYDMKESFLFLNGEFWGMYVITEKFSDKFFLSHYNIPTEDLLYNKDGEFEAKTPKEIINIYDFMDEYSKKDLTNDEYYKDICNVIDIDSLIEQFSIGIFIANTDWPGHNFGIWKYNGTDKASDNIYYDGKWRFMIYDFDYTMGNVLDGDFGTLEPYQYDMFDFISKKHEDSHPANLFKALLKNEEFKQKFMKSYENFVYNAMSMNIVNPIIKFFNEEISYFIGYSYMRWYGYLEASKEESIFNGIVNYKVKVLPKLKKFYEERPKYTLENMKNYLSNI